MPVSLVLRALAALLFIALLSVAASAQPVQAVPALTARLMDQTHTLSASELEMLESLLAGLERDTGAQVVVLMVPSTTPEDISAYANRIANTWKIGRKNIGDGVLLVVAKQDRKLRIEVAKSLEGAIPDLAAQRIIDESIAPHFKQGRFAEGLRSGIEHLSARIRTEALPAPASPSPPTPRGFNWADTSIFLFFAVPLVARLARAMFGTALGALLVGLGTGVLAYSWTHSYALASFAGLLAMVWTAFGSSGTGLSSGSPSGWPGASPGSGSHRTGGGFNSGGGGDFGGGGASGDW